MPRYRPDNKADMRYMLAPVNLGHFGSLVGHEAFRYIPVNEQNDTVEFTKHGDSRSEFGHGNTEWGYPRRSIRPVQFRGSEPRT